MEDDGAGGGKGSQAGAALEAVPVAGEDGSRMPPEEVPFASIPLEDSDAEEDVALLAKRLRRCAVLSDEDLGGSDRGACGEEVSSWRAHTEEATAGSSHQELGPGGHRAAACASSKGGAASRSRVKRKHWVLVDQ